MEPAIHTTFKSIVYYFAVVFEQSVLKQRFLTILVSGEYEDKNII